MNSQRTERGLLLRGGRADDECADDFVNAFFRVSAALIAEKLSITETSKEQPSVKEGKFQSEESRPHIQADFCIFSHAAYT